MPICCHRHKLFMDKVAMEAIILKPLNLGAINLMVKCGLGGRRCLMGRNLNCFTVHLQKTVVLICSKQVSMYKMIFHFREVMKKAPTIFQHSKCIKQELFQKIKTIV